MNKKIQALIVDDEELARSDLNALLSKIPYIEVAGEAENLKTAVDFIAKHNPDVIFLDIQLYRELGFDLFEKIEIKAKVIFVTAFDKYAIRAFDVNALDYLIKPVDPERLAITLERLMNTKEEIETKLPMLNYSDSIFIDSGNNFSFLRINSIVIISASGIYTDIFTNKSVKLISNKSMKEWETRLPQNTFVRIHRSVIINIDYIEKIDKWFNYSYQVYMKNYDKPLTISRRYLSAIKNRMS